VSGVTTMSGGFARSATRALTHSGLVLSPQRGRGLGLARSALITAALVAGAGAGYLGHERMQIASPPVPSAPSAPSALTAKLAEIASLEQQLEQSRLGLRLADARSKELERQIDALNQRLSESQDQLTFYRKAREGKH
jgi:phage shock protein A